MTTKTKRQPKGSNTRMVTVRLPCWIADWLKRKAAEDRYSQAKLIVDALRAHYGWRERGK